MTSVTSLPSHPPTRLRTVQVEGLDIAYREAGPADRPAVLLLHGFPTSSHMYRHLIPALADRYRVIAPDYPGFGASSAPDVADFAYTFDRLAEVLESFLIKIGCTRFALYMQDYGGPVGLRIAARHPEWVSALLIQNANAYLEGISPVFDGFKPFWAHRTPATEAPVRNLLTPAMTRFQFVQGTREPTALEQESWNHAQAHLDRSGNDQIQLALLHDYRNNPARFAEWHAYFRQHQPPTLITWGRNDPFFTEAGARAYLRDLPQAQLHLLDTGHFALEEDVGAITLLIRDFLARLG